MPPPPEEEATTAILPKFPSLPLRGGYHTETSRLLGNFS